MATPFLSSEEYDERAHQLYNEGQYDEALTVLREGLALYPNSVELHVGVGYAQLAREEFAWARRSFEQALVLEPEHEDALAGLGETLLKFGQDDAALRCFRRTLELGYADDLDLMLQIGRALFREASLARAARAVRASPRNSSRPRCSRRRRAPKRSPASATRSTGSATTTRRSPRCAGRCSSTTSTPKRASISRTSSTIAATTRRRSTTSSARRPKITGTSWGSGA